MIKNDVNHINGVISSSTKGPFRLLTAHMLLVNFCLILLIRMCTVIISQKKSVASVHLSEKSI